MEATISNNANHPQPSGGLESVGRFARVVSSIAGGVLAFSVFGVIPAIAGGLVGVAASWAAERRFRHR